MIEYPKINTLWKRDERNQIIEGDYSCPEFGFLADLPWQWTEKVDGTNIRIGWRPMDDHVDPIPSWIRGRTDNAQLPPKLVGHLIELWRSVPWAEAFPDLDVMSEVTLFGEGYGAGIQKGGQYRADQSFVLFDVKVGDWWLRRPDVEDVAAKLNLDVVPVVMESTIADAVQVVKEGFSSSWVSAAPEGLVGRPVVDLFNRKGERIITKIKRKDFR